MHRPAPQVLLEIPALCLAGDAGRHVADLAHHVENVERPVIDFGIQERQPREREIG
jgi:hypothetical protein